eukprot:TRINITY_DN9411_c0_g1_i10.p1 TRINITY_DN9411_c0_g1~~TRINITY_DN9411_c0_g1_i10.p1  ORF type:complete len:355 (+),score=32.07 TRINITY_DN9411_c0_g1_i10:95-1159(+)
MLCLLTLLCLLCVIIQTICVIQTGYECVWNATRQRCEYEQEALFSLFNSSQLFYTQYLTCEYIHEEETCVSQSFESKRVCEWDQNGNSCEIAKRQLVYDLMKCVDNECQDQLKGIDIDSFDQDPFTCSFLSCQEQGQFCETVVSRINRQKSINSSSVVQQSQPAKETTYTTSVDELILSIVEIGDKGDCPFDSAVGDLDEVLGLQKGALEKYLSCRNIQEELECTNNAQTQQQDVGQFEQKEQSNQGSRNAFVAFMQGPGVLVYFLVGKIFFLCAFVCFLRYMASTSRKKSAQDKDDTKRLIAFVETRKFTFTKQETVKDEQSSDMHDMRDMHDMCSICHENYEDQELMLTRIC